MQELPQELVFFARAEPAPALAFRSVFDPPPLRHPHVPERPAKFQKKTAATSKQDKDIAAVRYRAVVNARRGRR
jgi:hypothetical protein